MDDPSFCLFQWSTMSMRRCMCNWWPGLFLICLICYCVELRFFQLVLYAKSPGTCWTNCSNPLTPSVNVTGLEQPYYRRQATVVNPFPYGFLKTPRIACPGGVFLVIVVHSHPSYRDRRDAIRRTWGRYGNGHEPAPRLTRLVFALALDATSSDNQLRSESEIYDDIIQGNFTDAYRNMTLKSLLGLKWVSENCARVPYMLKSDDDMFISIPYLINTLLNKSMKRSVMGPYNHRSMVHRIGKWAVDRKLFPDNYYPPYVSGACYVITVDIVRELYETSAYVTPIFIEDVYVTGILTRIIGAKHIRHMGFAYASDRSPKPCFFIKHFKISGTHVTPKHMYALWKGVHSIPLKSCGLKTIRPKTTRLTTIRPKTTRPTTIMPKTARPTTIRPITRRGNK